MPEQTASPFGSPIIPFVIVFFIFYFLVIKPQKQKQKDQKNMLANIAKNDQIVTVGGIHGTVVNVKEKTVVVRIDDNVRVEFDREAVTSVAKSSDKN